MDHQLSLRALVLALGYFSYGTFASAEPFYIGTEVGLSVTSREIVSGNLKDGSESGVAGGFFAGYDINNKVSVELSILSDAISYDSSNICYTHAGLSALYYPQSSSRHSGDSARLYGRIGLRMPLGISGGRKHRYEDELFPSVGIGLERQLNNGFSLRGEGLIIGSESYRLMAGVLMHFGGTPSPTISNKKSDASTNDTAENTFATTSLSQLTNIENNVVVEFIDSDNDGVADNDDRCRDTPKDTRVNDNGCVYLDNLVGINFALGSTGLTAETAAVLDLVSIEMKSNPELNVTVEGHTDNLGSSGFNKILSKRRAEAVREYIIRSHGISQARLTAVGLGDQQPVKPNNNKKNRFANRRVVFRISE